MVERGLRIAILLAAVVLAALLVRRAFRAGSAVLAPSQPRPDVFQYTAEVEIGVRAASTAVRLAGVLDLSVAELDAACEGEAAGLDTFVAHVRSAPTHDPLVLREQLAAVPEQCFEPPMPPGPCDWAAREIDARGALASAGWALLTHCPPGLASPFFDRPDAPADDVVEFVLARRVGSAWVGPAPRLPSQYARAVLEIASRSPLVPLRPAAGGVLAPRYDDPAVLAALSTLFDSAPDEARRSVVAEAAAVLSGARAQEMARTACEATPNLVVCLPPATFENVELLSDATSYVERRPAERPRALGLLEACARGGSAELVGAPSTCLARLATLDWDQARVVADGLASSDPALAGVASVLRQYPSPSALTLALRTRGLLGEQRPVESPAVTVVTTMAAYGRGWILGPQSAGTYGHDRLARHLLRLGDMADVTVEEVPDTGPPAISGPLAAFVRATRLRASSRGETFAGVTTSDGDYLDLGAIVGLLNVVARARGANVRYLVVSDPLAYEAIVLGPPSALASALDEGLLTLPTDEEASPLPF